MTVNEAIARVSRGLNGTVDRETLVLWLSEIENTVVYEIAASHENDNSDKSPINTENDGARELFARDPFSELYVNYLIMKSDLALRDTAQYLNSLSVFATSYNNFADWYNRTHMPVGEERTRVRK